MARRVAKLKTRALCDSFPTDVEKLAEMVGIIAVRAVPLAIRGRLTREPGGLVVEVNSALSTEDRRFVLAHEVAHILLEQDAIDRAAGRFQRSAGEGSLGYRQVEALCDFGAREIVLPLGSLRAKLRKHAPSPAVVLNVSKEAACSVQVTIERICELCGAWKPASYLLWKTTRRGTRLLRVVPDTSKEVELADETNSVVTRALLRPVVVSGSEKMWAGTEIQEFAVQALIVGSGEVLMMASPQIH